MGINTIAQLPQTLENLIQLTMEWSRQNTVLAVVVFVLSFLFVLTVFFLARVVRQKNFILAQLRDIVNTVVSLTHCSNENFLLELEADQLLQQPPVFPLTIHTSRDTGRIPCSPSRHSCP